MEDLTTAPKDGGSESPPSPLSVGWCILALLAGIFGSTLTGVVAIVVTGYTPGDPLPVSLTVASLIGLWAGLSATVVLAYSLRQVRGKQLLRALGLVRPNQLIWIWAGPLIGVASQVVLGLVLYLPLRLISEDTYNSVDDPARELTEQAHSAIGIAVMIVFVGLLAPLFEEVFFRGTTLPAFYSWRGRLVGIIGSSLLFAISHLQLVQFPALFLFGVLLAVLTLRTRSVWPAVAAHSGFNVLSLVLLFWFQP